MKAQYLYIFTLFLILMFVTGFIFFYPVATGSEKPCVQPNCPAGQTLSGTTCLS